MRKSVRSFTRGVVMDSLESRRLLSASALVKSSLPVTQSLLTKSSATSTLALADAFAPLNGLNKPNARAVAATAATKLVPFSVDSAALKAELASAPKEFSKAAKAGGLLVAIPSPDGTMQRFKVLETELIAGGSKTAKTFVGQGVDDKTATIRMDYTVLGFHVQVLSAKGNWYVDPYWKSASSTHVAYYRKDLAVQNADTGAWTCDTTDVHDDAGSLASELGIELDAAPYGTQLKTYRLAVGTSSAYTAVFGNATNATAAITTAINRVTGVYETELAIRLSLVFNTGVLISQFGNSSSVINTSTSTMNSLIGAANYDIGHIFTTGSGGVAFLGCVGMSNKAGGTTGLTGLGNLTSDTFYIDYVAHEMGHQFGANHTFNTSMDPNRSAAHAYEPGSGVSIMGYAGLEGSDDLAGHSIANFNHDSIDAIRTFVTSAIPSVGTTTNTGNTAPTVDAGLDYTIPTGTPFALTATGSDPDGNPLTYDWQQRDLGSAKTLASADSGSGPLFTQIAPLTSPTRNLPTLSSILGGFTGTAAGGSTAQASGVLGAGANAGNLAERLYTAARSASNWRVIARDNRAGGGGVSSDDMVLTVVNTGAAFAITNLNSATALVGGTTQSITWNVAGTTANGINAANVNILLSTDGGQTFGTVLASNVANDGSESVVLPNTLTSNNVRIKVQPTNNIFFDINNAVLSIQPGSAISQATAVPFLSAGYDTGISGSDNLTRLNNNGVANRLQFTVNNTVAGALVEVLANGVVVGSKLATGTSTDVLTNGVTVIANGPVSFTARQTETGKSVSAASALASVTIDAAAPTAFFGNIDSPRVAPVSSNFIFTDETIYNVDPSDFTLTRDGSPVSLAGATVDNSSGTGFTLGGLTAATSAKGNYSLTVNGAGNATDAAGNPVVSTAVTWSKFILGDMNDDGIVNNTDIAAFVLALTDASGYAAAYPGVPQPLVGDINSDGIINNADIAPFVALLTGGRPAGSVDGKGTVATAGPASTSDSLFGDSGAITAADLVA